MSVCVFLTHGGGESSKLLLHHTRTVVVIVNFLSNVVLLGTAKFKREFENLRVRGVCVCVFLLFHSKRGCHEQMAENKIIQDKLN
jgi:hypothetical protein